LGEGGKELYTSNMQLTEYTNTKWNSEFNWHNLQVRGGMGSL